MDEYLQRQDSMIQFRSSHLGCFWGLRHILDYHPWHNVKKKLSYKKQRRGTRSRGSGISQTILNDGNITEIPEYVIDEAKPLLVKLGPIPNSWNKRSGNSRIKVIIANEMSVKESREYWKLDSPAQTRLNQVSSTHNLRHSDYPPIDDLSHQRTREITGNSFQDHVDVKEIFEVNKKLFVEMLQGPQVRTNTRKIGLGKASSFPAAHLPATTLKHKQYEFLPRGGGKSIQGFEASKLVTNSAHKSQKTSKKISSIESPPELKNQPWSRYVVNRFNVIKQKIRHVFKERRNSNNPNTVNEVVSSEMPENVETISRREGEVKDRVFSRMTRTSSLNDSLEKYTQLFDSSFNKDEVIKQQQSRSRSLKLTSENKLPRSELDRRFYGRNLSLPDLDLFCSLFNNASHEDLHTEIPSISRENIEVLDSLSTLDEADSENVVSNHSQELNMGCKLNSGPEVSDKHPILSEGCDLTQSLNPINEPGPSTIIQIGSSADSIPGNGSAELNHDKTFDIDYISDDADFDYVRYVLQNSGLTANENLTETQNFIDGPLDSLLFKSLETCLDNVEFSGNTDRHRLLFDLVNKTLVDIYETSFSHFPKPLSFNHYINQMKIKKGSLVDEVWGRMSRYISSEPELDQTLDDMVARDLSKGDVGNGWMKIQFETECVGLEIEELLLDELLVEVIISVL